MLWRWNGPSKTLLFPKYLLNLIKLFVLLEIIKAPCSSRPYQTSFTVQRKINPEMSDYVLYLKTATANNAACVNTSNFLNRDSCPLSSQADCSIYRIIPYRKNPSMSCKSPQITAQRMSITFTATLQNNLRASEKEVLQV